MSDRCDHSHLRFMSGGYYVTCVRCQQSWVALKKGATHDTDLDATCSTPIRCVLAPVTPPAEVETLRARVERLEGALRECANDLEAYVMREYSGDILTPGNALRRARDLAPVDAARAALENHT